MKRCTKCGLDKSLAEFYQYRNKQGLVVYVAACKRCKSGYGRQRRVDNPEQVRAYARAKYLLEAADPEKVARRNAGARRRAKLYRGADPEKFKGQRRRHYFLHVEYIKAAARIKNKKRYETVRHDVVDHYGGRCTCCGEGLFVFLAIDHKNNDGAEERRNFKQAKASDITFLRWIQKRGYPDGYQILCHNCNWAKYKLGECNHLQLSPAEMEMYYDALIDFQAERILNDYAQHGI